MKSVIEYLNECKQMADHNRLCYSATYGMDTPKPGYEKQFQEAVRDGEIADELIAMVSYPNSDRLIQSVELPPYSATREQIRDAMRKIRVEEKENG